MNRYSIVIIIIVVRTIIIITSFKEVMFCGALLSLFVRWLVVIIIQKDMNKLV